MNENPFILLKNTVNVLVVDDMPVITYAVREFLELFKIYTVSIANSTREAVDIIEKAEKRCHACLFDLGMNDVTGNEFHLLDTYKKIMPFVIMTSREDTPKAFECSKRGAKDFIKKMTVTSFNFYSLITSVNRYALKNLLYPEYDENGRNNIPGYIEAIVDTDPYKVKDWVNKLKISDRQVRNVWEDRLALTPKQTLCVYYLFSRLFQQINDSCKNNTIPDEHCLTQCARTLMESDDFRRWLDFYFLNIKKINASISRLPRFIDKEKLPPVSG